MRGKKGKIRGGLGVVAVVSAVACGSPEEAQPPAASLTPMAPVVQASAAPPVVLTEMPGVPAMVEAAAEEESEPAPRRKPRRRVPPPRFRIIAPMPPPMPPMPAPVPVPVV